MKVIGEISQSPGVYKITCKQTGKFYVGGSVDCRRRRYEHLYALRKSKHRSIRLQNAFAKYGEDAFVFEIIELCDKSSFRVREQHWLDQLKPFDRHVGLNMSDKAFPSNEGKPRSKSAIAKSKATWALKTEKCAHFRKSVVRSDGQAFVSLREAGRQTGVSETTILNAIKSGKKFRGYGYKYLKEVA